jgi:putative flavoprotein involved in K+ transport
MELFADDCYWRDLISFTWNIKTLEGKAEIQAMLAATLSHVQADRWQMLGEASHQNGVTADWFTFETAAARGKGYLRLKNCKCWTLLTSMTELKGFEEKKGRGAHSRRAARVIQESTNLAGKESPGRGRTGLRHATLLRHYRRRAGRDRLGGTAETTGCTDDHH